MSEFYRRLEDARALHFDLETLSSAYLDSSSEFFLLTGFPLIILPDSTDNVAIRFIPEDAFSSTNVLHVSTNDPSNQEVEVSLEGYGYLPIINISADTLFFFVTKISEDRFHLPGERDVL